MPRRCAFGCEPRGVPMHRFPDARKFPERFQSWVNLLGGKLKTASDFDYYKTKRICDIHFSDQHRNYNNRLSALAVPLFHLPEVLHAFPKPDKFPDRFKTWLNIVGGKPETLSNYEFYKKMRICDIHFSYEQRNRFKRLNALAVPCLHLPEVSATLPLDVDVDAPPTSTQSSTNILGENNIVPVCNLLVEHNYCGIRKHISTRAVNDHLDKGPTSSEPSTSETLTSKSTTTELPTVNASLSEPATSEPIISEDKSVPQIAILLPSKLLEDNIEKIPPSLKCIDYVDKGESTIEEPEFEFMDDDDTETFTEHNTVLTQTIPVINTLIETKNKTDANIASSKPLAELVPDDTCIRDAKLLSSCIEDYSPSYWKQTLNQILHSAQFCGICLRTDGDMKSMQNQFEIVAGGRTHTRTLADILHAVFRETEELMASSQICNICIKKLIRSYMFIEQARERSRMLSCHVNDLYTKSCFIRNNVISKDAHKETGDVQNVLIALEKYDNVGNFCNNVTAGKTDKKTVLPKPKMKFKCVACNLLLPSHKAWRRHEISVHKRLTERPLKKRCHYCLRLIPRGRYLDHVKKYHEHSSCSCPKCNLTLSSFKDLETHMRQRRCRKKYVYSCAVCDLAFSSLNDVETHTRRKHPR